LKTIPRDQHCISRRNISQGALKVMARLRSQNFEAYLVGGAVRDLLLGKQPKDFDVATNARPEEVAALFRNSRIIGRRFRIVHVRFGPEIIEVTTFRGHHEDAEDDAGQRPAATAKSHVSASGRLLRDNVFGNMDEDAARRDLTINALFYDAGTFAVFDYADGLRDLATRTVRVIGDSEQRYREDPVRMLRVIRFAAKLDFLIAPGSGDPIRSLAPLLCEIPPARLFDEFLKLFLSGTAAPTLRLMESFGLAQQLFPATWRALAAHRGGRELLEAAMRGTDERVSLDKPVTPAFLLAALLWPALCHARRQCVERGETPHAALSAAAQDVLNEQLAVLAIPRRFSLPMKEIWELQWRLEQRQGRKAVQLLGHRRFRAAYDLLLLRAAVGDAPAELADTWTELQAQTPPEQIADATSEEDEEPSVMAEVPSRRRRPQRRRAGPPPPGPPALVEAHMADCFIGLGSNLEQPQRQIEKALAALAELPHTALVAVSPHYRTRAIGPGSQPDYINAVAQLRTVLEPEALLRQLHRIETQQGRERRERWAARTLDLDLLLYDQRVIASASLTLPHPRLHHRDFVLRPLCDLAPDLTLPDGSRVCDHLAALTDSTLRDTLHDVAPAALSA